jgi:hypothetical protein
MTASRRLTGGADRLNFRIWFSGALISNIGTWTQRTAQDWLVFDHLTENPDSVAQALPRFRLVSTAGANPRACNGRRRRPGPSPDDAVER